MLFFDAISQFYLWKTKNGLAFLQGHLKKYKKCFCSKANPFFLVVVHSVVRISAHSVFVVVQPFNFFFFRNSQSHRFLDRKQDDE